MPLCPFPLQKERERKGKGKVKTYTSGAYPGFINMKHLEVLLLPSGRDASPLQGYPSTVCRRCSCPFVNGRCHFEDRKVLTCYGDCFYQKERKSQPKVKPGPQTRTIRILISPLPIHYHTDPPKRRKIYVLSCLSLL